jgi:ubiquinone/menaquinone biosynthesis C-methylase UbiE
MKTDWNNVAAWYDSYLSKEDTYQAKVIAPNLLRILGPKDKRILDIACGQGYFSKLCAKEAQKVVGIDLSELLIEKAREEASEKEHYIVCDAEKLETLSLEAFDTSYCVLAFENIKNIKAVLEGVYAMLKPSGTFVVVLLHPSFRIPQHSDWGYSMEKQVQFRKVFKYLSEISIPITLNPFKGKTTKTITFHRPLQWYTKLFKSTGFVITTIEEWISHKKSEPGPRQKAEDAARKEIPLFMAIELKKIT